MPRYQPASCERCIMQEMYLKIPFLLSREAKGSNEKHTLNFRIAKILWSKDFSWIHKHLAPLQIQALLLGMVDIKPGGLH